LNIPEVKCYDELGDPCSYFEDISIDEELVYSELSKVKSFKSPGIDGITSTLISKLKGSLTKPLVYLFRQSFDTCKIPSEWKDAIVTPLFKKGKKTLPDNYRPISLTSQVGHIFERVIKSKLSSFLESSGKISNSQHGFRSGKSTKSNLLEFSHELVKDIDKGNCADTIYLDFKKAFDKVPHKRLINKLHGCGVRGKVLDWLTEWLHGRYQQVRYDNILSLPVQVRSGVPQGSVLGPLLFLVYINDLDDNLNNKIFKFADDTKLLGTVDKNINVVSSIQDDLNKLMSWSEKWLMPFNTEKCRVMHYGNGNPCREYFLNGVKMETSTEEIDLGVLFSNDLKVEDQCLKAAKSANKVLGMVKRTF
jgi:hypothetical protein